VCPLETGRAAGLAPVESSLQVLGTGQRANSQLPDSNPGFAQWEQEDVLEEVGLFC